MVELIDKENTYKTFVFLRILLGPTISAKQEKKSYGANISLINRLQKSYMQSVRLHKITYYLQRKKNHFLPPKYFLSL